MGHGSRYHYSRGCRCKACREAQASYMRAWRDRRSTLSPGDPRHGTASGYSNFGCRCADCTRANTEHGAEYRRRQREEGRSCPG